MVGLVAGIAALATAGVVGSQMLPSDEAQASRTQDVGATVAKAEAPAKAIVASNDEPSGGVDLAALPDAEDEEEDEEAAAAVGGPLPSAAKEADSDEDAEDEADELTRGPKGDLEEGINDAVGDVDTSTDEVKMGGSGKRTHEIPRRPPQGAVAAGVRPGRMGAKACVAGADGVTRVQLSFASSGAVTSINVGGWAAKHGKAGCVKAAFQGVNVGQFQDASYSFPVSVRP